MNEYLRSGSLNLVNRESLVTRQRWYVYSQKEVHLYGGSRLGIDETERPLMRVQVSEVWNPFNGTWCDPVAVQGQAREVWVNGAWVGENTPFPAQNYERFVDSTGKKRYELSNHLGNVLAVVSDRKLPQYQGNLGVIAFYEADQLSLKLYDPFGTIAQEWRITGTYRYSFNGKESDSEWDGGGAMFDYGFRIYDPRLRRFLSVDPLTEGYPYYTPYQFAGNMPIFAIDVDGLEPNYTLNENEKGTVDCAYDKSDGKEYGWTWMGESWKRELEVCRPDFEYNEALGRFTSAYNINYKKEFDKAYIEHFNKFGARLVGDANPAELDAIASQRAFDQTWRDFSSWRFQSNPEGSSDLEILGLGEHPAAEYQAYHWGSGRIESASFQPDDIIPLKLAGKGVITMIGFAATWMVVKGAAKKGGMELVEQGVKKWSRSYIRNEIGLPFNKGHLRFVPEAKWKVGQPLRRGPNGGYMDRFDNEWLKPRGAIQGEFHWDVQLSKNASPWFKKLSNSGKHVNVTQHGSLAH